MRDTWIVLVKFLAPRKFVRSMACKRAPSMPRMHNSVPVSINETPGFIHK